MVDELAAAMLRKQLLKNLEALEEQAKSEGKQLTQKKNVNGISVSCAFDVELEHGVAAILAQNIPFLTSFVGKTPATVKEFVRFAGGLSNTIEKLMNYRISGAGDKPLLQHQEAAVIDYVDVIEQILVKAKGLTPQKPSSDQSKKDYTELALPFCALCFKRVNQSPYYCKEHHSSRNATTYKKATRRLLSAVYRHTDDYEVQSKLEDHKRGKERLDARTLYCWLNLFSVEPRLVMSELLKLDRDNAGWQSYAEAILTFAREHYPHAYKQVRATGDSASCYDKWIVDVTRLLGGEIEANLWKIKDAYIWLDNSNNIQKSLTLLNCLRRYEAFTIVNNFPVLSGAKQGTNTNTAKREQLKQLLKERDNDPSITMNEIAKRLGVSRTAVYKLKNKII
ncbi:helix-turn-helix domain-containing protein [Vibrio parahaemolyticus]|uniref:helix-turn-helix domain-containing protein n=2 Tax=Vibrio alginolyticus TaxID=663 RepID=UPI00215CFB8F|nr:helix-turn-helix domain-containing protein [Vibrio alginolyticus]MCR9319513.1 helix-turn-helix domain-containing protein [Vibrio alginolyticus]MCR9402270.1 helix-turn-helix domain-containing protein [Vibrio alginolyticus]MCR9468450.1 helix-turn-helix domain-containing protein [Vibrio alginolyticus]MCR9480058.1 helix-turn-helix domain-containing protein [Vibrio alginolyticus]MCS0249601.1 helix-turn-helix domain-containing protein [Vibrio alginolyticus]